MTTEPETPRPYCLDCNAVGLRHCSDPVNCGNVIEPGDPKWESYEVRYAKYLAQKDGRAE